MRLFDERGGRPNTPIWKVMPDCEPARPTTLDQSAGQEGGEFGLQAGADEHQLTEIRARRPPPVKRPDRCITETCRPHDLGRGKLLPRPAKSTTIPTVMTRAPKGSSLGAKRLWYTREEASAIVGFGISRGPRLGGTVRAPLPRLSNGGREHPARENLGQ